MKSSYFNVIAVVTLMLTIAGALLYGCDNGGGGGTSATKDDLSLGASPTQQRVELNQKATIKVAVLFNPSVASTDPTDRVTVKVSHNMPKILTGLDDSTITQESPADDFRVDVSGDPTTYSYQQHTTATGGRGENQTLTYTCLSIGEAYVTLTPTAQWTDSNGRQEIEDDPVTVDIECVASTPADGDADSDEDNDADIDRDADCDCDGDCDCDCDCDADCDCDSDRDADGDSAEESFTSGRERHPCTDGLATCQSSTVAGCYLDESTYAEVSFPGTFRALVTTTVAEETIRIHMYQRTVLADGTEMLIQAHEPECSDFSRVTRTDAPICAATGTGEPLTIDLSTIYAGDHLVEIQSDCSSETLVIAETLML